MKGAKTNVSDTGDMISIFIGEKNGQTSTAIQGGGDVDSQVEMVRSR